MVTVVLKVPTMTAPKIATDLKSAISQLPGVTLVQADHQSHNLKVAFDPQVTTLTAIQYTLSLARHPHASFAGGSRKRGWT